MNNCANEMQRQEAKERAVLLALQNDMALIRRDLEVFGMMKDGTMQRISDSANYDNLWCDALRALESKTVNRK